MFTSPGNLLIFNQKCFANACRLLKQLFLTEVIVCLFVQLPDPPVQKSYFMAEKELKAIPDPPTYHQSAVPCTNNVKEQKCKAFQMDNCIGMENQKASFHRYQTQTQHTQQTKELDKKSNIYKDGCFSKKSTIIDTIS